MRGGVGRLAVPLSARRAPSPTLLSAATVGWRVPTGEFDAVVHSAFEHACNLETRGSLLTLVTASNGDAPTAIVLGGAARTDLRNHFDRTMPLRCRGGVLRGSGVAVQLAGAGVWRPPSRAALLPPQQIRGNVAFAVRHLAHRRLGAASVIGPIASERTAALACAVRTLDTGAAERALQELIGWGEGLTPAGDDFVIGLLAGVEWLAHDAPRQRFLAALRRAAHAAAPGTTDVAAHLLRLAADGHYADVLERLRIALLCGHRSAFLERTLHDTLAIGATSGADTVDGLLDGISAWLPGATIEGAR